MNETLARLYGTGLDKTASAEDDIDLSQISAADFLAAVENGDIVMDGEELEKEADGEELDLENMSPDELVELAQYLDSLEGEQGDDDTLEKMAESGELEHWDMVGRVMAHSYADEMDKVAFEDDYEDEIFGLDELSAEDLMEGLDSGELEIVELDDEFEKDAGMQDKLMSFLRRFGQDVGASTPKSKGFPVKGIGRSEYPMVKGKKGMGQKMKDLMAMLNTATGGKYRRGAKESFRELRGLQKGNYTGGKSRKRLREQIAARGAIGYGAPAVAVGGTGAGAYTYNKRKKNR